MTEYQEFLASKRIRAVPSGFKIQRSKLNKQLMPFQADIVQWALALGRCGIFADCGLGKTFMQSEWAKHVSRATEKPTLIFAPLAVAEQTVREGQKFGIGVSICTKQGEIVQGIDITNYEKLQHFPDATQFGGLVLDESSILKGFDGKTRKALTEWASIIPFRLACTATPAPNDYMELGNHAEFLGIMTCSEMLSMFFVHDGGDTSKWRLKKHAEQEFWKWVASWAVAIRRPSDLGYDDGDFVLQPLEIHQITVDTNVIPDGYLFSVEARTLQERNQARKDSTSDRVKACADIVNNSEEAWIVWCNLNQESEALNKAIDDAVEITGSDTPEFKKSQMLAFAEGETRVLVSKPSICGFGMNFQVCHNVAFVGLSDSYESFYQAVRRCWRFGQKSPVKCYIITSEAEGAVVKNIERKEQQAVEMMEGMVKHMKSEMQKNLKGSGREEVPHVTEVKKSERWTAILGDCVESVAAMESASVDYTIFSPPFSSLYTYSNSDRDMGNVKDYAEFEKHFRFLIPELFRVTKPGRLLSFHCMNLPISKQMEGFIGIRDFRGELIRMFLGDEYIELKRASDILNARAIAAAGNGETGRVKYLEQAIEHIRYELENYKSPSGWILHSECVIWKDPVTAMQRTKALGLLYKQLRKDSCMSRQGIPDYLVTMRKPGDNPERVTKTHESFPVDRWQRYASPVWMDINPSDTLQKESAREHNDERHICPLQLEVISRAIELWTNPDDLVLSPFAGIGSEGYVALENGRRFVGVELKRSYWEQAVKNLEYAAIHAKSQGGLFDEPESKPETGRNPDGYKPCDRCGSNAMAWDGIDGPWVCGLCRNRLLLQSANAEEPLIVKMIKNSAKTKRLTKA